MKGTRVLLGLALMVVALAGCSLDGGLSLRAEGDGGVFFLGVRSCLT